MAGGKNSFKDKIMFEIYKANDYTDEYRVVYFSELDDHNRDKEIDNAMNWARDLGIATSTELIFGLPYETRDSFVDLLNRDLKNEHSERFVIFHNRD